MISRDSEPSSPSVRSHLREAVGRVRRSLFGGANQAGEGMWIGAGRIDTERIDIDDEAVVHRLLDARNGRIKQGGIVERTDWSSAKVSRLLTTMEKRGEIERVRIGREKVVVSPDRGDAT